MTFSIIIPARDEEAHIGACLDSIEEAARRLSGGVETIVVINRCTDGTEEIARRRGARIVRDDSKNLARIRNAGARVATGDTIVTMDADSRMSPNMLEEVDKALASGKYIGGGVPIRAERASVGILLSAVMILLCVVLRGVRSAGLFWCRRKDFEAIGGFDESWVTAEDIDFARRLQAYGRKAGLKYGTLWKTHIWTSCRKFDGLGDWYLLRHPIEVMRVLRGKDHALGDRFFYEFEHRKKRGEKSSAKYAKNAKKGAD